MRNKEGPETIKVKESRPLTPGVLYMTLFVRRVRNTRGSSSSAGSFIILPRCAILPLENEKMSPPGGALPMPWHVNPLPSKIPHEHEQRGKVLRRKIYRTQRDSISFLGQD